MSQEQSWRGTIGKLSAEEYGEYLSVGRIVRLACIDKVGNPYIAPMWYEWDPEDNGFWVIPRQKSAWAKYLKNNPSVAITIDEDAPPYRKVIVRGHAELVEEPNVGGQWVEIATKMSYRYLGENGPDYLEPTLNEPRWLFKIKPSKIKTWQGVEWAEKYKTSH